MSSLYDRIINLLQQHQIAYHEYDHDPILNYEDAEREKQRLGWSGVESKNVFLKGTNGTYYLYVTLQGQRLDFAKLKELLGTKISLASEDDVRTIIECVPGCVAPFGFHEGIVVIIDPQIFQHEDYLFSPGITTKTIHTNIKHLQPIFDTLPNTIIRLP